MCIRDRYSITFGWSKPNQTIIMSLWCYSTWLIPRYWSAVLRPLLTTTCFLQTLRLLGFRVLEGNFLFFGSLLIYAIFVCYSYAMDKTISRMTNSWSRLLSCLVNSRCIGTTSTDSEESSYCLQKELLTAAFWYLDHLQRTQLKPCLLYTSRCV